MAEFEPRHAFEHLDKLAYEIGPRLAGTRGDRLAADYIQKQFEESGLKVRRQEFGFVNRSARTKVTACIFGTAFVASLFLPPELSLAVWLAALCIWRSLSALMPKRRSQNIIVTLKVGKPKRRVAVTAHYDSAPCMISYKLHLFVRFTFLPTLAIVTLVLTLRALGILPGWPLVWGVLAFIFLPVCAGLFITASSRRVSPGAYDNASGVAVMLEVARVFSEAPPKDMELSFIAFGAEEQGLVGARKLVESKVLAEDTRVLNLDGVGLGSQAYVIEGNGILRRRRTSPELNDVLADSIKSAGLQPKLKWAALAGQDHIPLVRAKMLATTFTQEAVDKDELGRFIGKAFALPNAGTRGYRYLHTLEDTPEGIELSKIEHAGQVVLGFIKKFEEQSPVEVKK